jgi:hypothetical protein
MLYPRFFRLGCGVGVGVGVGLGVITGLGVGVGAGGGFQTRLISSTCQRVPFETVSSR